MRKRVRTLHRAAVEALEVRALLTVAPLPDPVAYPTYIIQKAFGNTPPISGLLAGGITPAASPPAAAEITPAQMLQAYGVNNIKFGSVVGNGAGQTIAIIDAFDDPNAFSDLTNFDTTYNLPVISSSNFTKLNETGGTTLPAAGGGWQVEESLDIEWAHVIAPAASIILYEANSASFSDLVQNAVNTARKNPAVSVVSMSFGGGEFSGETTYDTYFTTPTSPAHQGVTFLASTGDTGSPAGYPSFSPNVVAVGGTTLLLNSDGSYNSETAWSGSAGVSGTGGGTSTMENAPNYQIGTQTTGKRTTPDISMDANPSTGVPVYDSYNGGWFQVGGTSLAAPMTAALIAIADQGRVLAGFSTLDGPTQTLPMLYSSPSTFFHDVTSGSNGGFTAGPGYDEVTGIGTPIANLLVPALAEATSSVALTSSANPSASAQSVTFTATVTSSTSGTPSGTITFKNGTTVLGTGTLNASGVATLATTTLPIGADTITASYTGDSIFAPSRSTTLTQTVNHLATTTTLATSGTPSKSGQSVTFTATVTGSGTPTGTVTFKDGTTTLGTGTLNGSHVATFTTTSLSVASHSITASYGGDATFASSVSSTLTQIVQQAASSTVLGATPNPSVFGQVVTLTATVALSGAGGGTPTGTVTFKNGSTTLGTGTLTAGVATFTTSSLSLGSKSLTASYGGSTNFASSASSTVTQVINQASSATALTSTANPSVVGQSITLTATVTALSPSSGTPTGTVTFKDGSTTLGTGTLNGSGVATFSTSSLALGSHSITATYGGSTNYAGSASSTLSQSVTLASSSTALVSNNNPAAFGQSVTFTATVTSTSPGTPTGTVTFMDGSATLGTGTLNASGVATYSTSTLSAASHSITASYSGDSNFAGSPSPALVQSVTTAAAASFITTDTATQGNWTGVYGSDGYSIFNGNSSLPSYAQLSASNALSYTWSTDSGDPRGLQTSAGSTSRIAACDFSGTSFTLNLNLTDGQAHRVAIYLLDGDLAGRAEAVQVTDAVTGAVLDTRTPSNFGNGQWLVWNLTGNVNITFTNTGPVNAVASGIFFGPQPTPTTAAANFITTDTATQGNWTGVYGSEGYSIFNGNSSLPSYAQLSASNALSYTWSTDSGDPRGLQTSAGSTSRIAACDFSGTSFTLNLNLTDGQTHQVAIYLLDGDLAGRAEAVQVTDAVTGAVLDTRTPSNFGNGQWLVWNLTGNVKITFTNTGPVNAVASGIFFGPQATPATTAASFLTTDTATQGNWTGVYGSDGYSIFNGNSSLPSYAQLSASNALNWTWSTDSSDGRGLQTSAGSTGRIAASDFSATSFTLSINLTDGQTHQVAIYLLDWDMRARTETVQVTDAASGVVLDTRTPSNFSNGQWLVWNLTGNVKITFTNTGPVNAVASGIFFGPPTGAPPVPGVWSQTVDFNFATMTTLDSRLTPHEWWNNGPTTGLGQEMSDPNNVVLANGVLNLYAQADNSFGTGWTGALVQTSGVQGDSSIPTFSFLYGYAQATIKVPAGQGLWPAFWLLPESHDDNNGELDIMEMLGSDTSTVYQTAHRQDAYEEHSVQTTDLSEGFHTFGVDWEPGSETFYIDGKVTAVLTNTALISNEPARLILDLAVGGSWAGPPDATTPSPADMQVSDIQVWQH